jgi:predicted  nucleic acid-binding Zn-ribbon protein
VDDETKKAFETLTAEMRAGFERSDKALEFLASEMQAGFARVYGRFDQVSEALGSLNARMSALEEQVGKVEDKVVALVGLHVELSTRFLHLEIEVREIKARLERLSKDILLGRTEDAERYRALQLRLGAVEKALEPRS